MGSKLNWMGSPSLLISVLINLIHLSHAGSGGSYKSYTTKSFATNLKLNLVVPPSFYRLNLTVLPLNYTLRFRPVMEDGYPPPLQKFSFPSTVSIRVQAISSSDTITLHQRGLELDQDAVSVIQVRSGKNLTILNQSLDKDRDFYEIKLEKSFEPGDILEVYIPYRGNLTQDEQQGFFLGQYEDPATNQTRYLSAMKLEPYHARKVFPSFDEPSLKATFTIIVGRVEGKYHSLSNMDLVRTEQDEEYPGWVWDHYAESVLMSTYLVCVVVSDYHSETVLDSKNRPYSAWAPQHLIKKGGASFHTSAGARLLTFFEKKFKMDYALPKLDSVALPKFMATTMENYGLLTFRNEFLLWVPGENTQQQKKRLTELLSHEIVHQWYGNVVTCAWWSDIWLNEGFAQFLMWWGMEEVIPEFDLGEAFVHDITQLAMSFDQGPETHPLRNKAESPKDSSGVFNRISYEKGSSILKMMEWILTPPVFLSGIVDVYLERMKWTSATQQDFFKAMREAVELNNGSRFLPDGKTIVDVMTAWTYQSGYPIVRVGVVDEKTITLSQEKFKLNHSKVGEEDNAKWWIPVAVRIFEDGNKNDGALGVDLWIPQNDSDNLTYSKRGLNTSKLIMINPDGLGYYRVLYDEPLTELIRQQLLKDHSLIISSSRSKLIDDYFNLAWGKYVEVEKALELIEYVGKETKANVWRTVLDELDKVRSKFTQSEGALKLLAKYYLPRVERGLEAIGVRQGEREGGANVTLRFRMLDFIRQMGRGPHSDYAEELFGKWKLKPEVNPVPVDIRFPIYCIAITNFGDDGGNWEFLLERAKETPEGNQKYLLLSGVACTGNQTKLGNLLDMAVTDLGKYQDHIVTRVAMNWKGREVAWKFLKDSLGDGSVTPEVFGSVVQTLSSVWREEKDILELKQIIAKNEKILEKQKASLDESLENVKETIEWWNSFGFRIEKWLEKNSGS